MADDIAACPHSLAERETAVADGMCPICSADALSRLTTPPLPEIARLIEELSCTEGPGGPFVLPVICQEAADALRALAQENARLKADNKNMLAMLGGDMGLSRIAELEAERDNFREDAERAIGHAAKFAQAANAMKNERDAIRAKTFEECAVAADDWFFSEDRDLRGPIIEVIRALSQTDEGKTESGK